MSRRIGVPVRVKVNAASESVRFTWRGHVCAGEVIGQWHLRDRWWDRKRESDRVYYRLLTADHQMFDVVHPTLRKSVC